jgi:predicted amidophosphoribosyltransferase
MINISPKQIKGKWTLGYALDVHTLSSEYMGHNEYGHPQFDTKYSDMGQLLNRLKYKSDKSVLGIIIDTAVEFLNSKDWPLDMIVPVPPSRSIRTFQPVMAVAKGISKSTGMKLCTDCVVKLKQTPELKNIYELKKRLEILMDAYHVVKQQVEGRNLLLFDDLYRSGATLNAITMSLKNEGKAEKVYALTLTKTRRIT